MADIFHNIVLIPVLKPFMEGVVGHPTIFIMQVDKNKNGVVPSTEITVNVYTDFMQIQHLRCEWDDFVEENGGDIFMTYDWCRIWWKYYGKGRDLKIFIFRNNDGLVGIIPVFMEKIWLGPVFVRAAKIVGSDFIISQFSLPIADQHITTVIENFAELLSKENWDILHLGPLAGLFDNSQTITTACDKAFGPKFQVKQNKSGVQTYFELANTWQQQMAGLSKNERKKIKKSYRLIKEQGEKLTSTFASDENFTDAFDRFVQMHQSRWTKAGKAGHFGDWPAASHFHREVAEVQLKHKRLRLLKVKLDNTVIGYKYGYRFGEKLYAFLDARLVSQQVADYDLGRILFAEQAKKAIEDKNIKHIDSMRGKYKHKLSLGGKLFPIRSIFIFKKNLSVMIRIIIFRAIARLIHLSYYRIWYCRITSKLSVKTSPLREIWIRTRL